MITSRLVRIQYHKSVSCCLPPTQPALQHMPAEWNSRAVCIYSNSSWKKFLRIRQCRCPPIFYMTFLFQIPQILPLRLRSHQRDAAHLSTVLSLAQKSINMDLSRAMLFLMVSWWIIIDHDGSGVDNSPHAISFCARMWTIYRILTRGPKTRMPSCCLFDWGS